MIVVLTGAPGAGKGTQADLISEKLGFKKISTGDALRRQIQLGSDIGKKAQGFMSEGRLVPDEVLLGILKSELDAAGKQPVLLDGYPRNLSQAKALQEIVGQGAIKAAIHLDVDYKSLTGRITGRRTCPNCGASFHIINSQPKVGGVCDKCGGTLVQRPDDEEQKVTTRLQIYENDTRPILDFYRDLGLYHRVDGNGSTSQVFQDLSKLLHTLGA
ncbi:MAG: nucleoside monophosphate kinase [Bdellovibrionota bacterium]